MINGIQNYILVIIELVIISIRFVLVVGRFIQIVKNW